MKKIFLTLSAAILGSALLHAQENTQQAAAAAAAALAQTKAQEAAAQKPDYWTSSVDFELGFNQTGLFNWAAGGYNTVTLGAGIDAKAAFAKDLTSWSNRLQLQYGFLWSADKVGLLQKSNDRIYLESKLTYKTSPKSKWNYSASLDFRTQFSDSYDNYLQVEDLWVGDLKSAFMSPAYLNLALGLDWKPNSWFGLNIAPLTGGLVICTTTRAIEEYTGNEEGSSTPLRQKYGMQLKNPGTTNPTGKDYNSCLFQLGAQVKADLKLSLNDKLTYESQLVLFTDYLNKPFAHNRVNWDNKLAWQAAKFFRVSFNTWLIYDPIVVIDEVASKVQFKEFFAISLNYTLTGKKK